MSGLSAQQVQALIWEAVPQAQELGLIVEAIETHCAQVRIPFKASLVRLGGTLSGPTQMALADAAMFAAILGAVGGAQMAVTSQLSINFLAKPDACDLLAKATILRLSARQAFCQVELFCAGDPTLVAHVTGTYALAR